MTLNVSRRKCIFCSNRPISEADYEAKTVDGHSAYRRKAGRQAVGRTNRKNFKKALGKDERILHGESGRVQKNQKLK